MSARQAEEMKILGHVEKILLTRLYLLLNIIKTIRRYYLLRSFSIYMHVLYIFLLKSVEELLSPHMDYFIYINQEEDKLYKCPY